jgi:two-component system, OmpR family, alkaline phosphatase synthesis response regulator PhoP
MSETPYRMLIVEDDPDIGVGLEDYFEMQGFNVTRVIDGEAGLDEMRNQPSYDVVLLDVMLPKKNGFDVLRESQELGVDSPVLMLTGRGDQEAILQGFGLGADDYIVKPFNADELSARVRAILARTLPPDRTPMDVYRIGDVEINFSTHEAHRDGELMNFTALEFDILRYLIHNRGRTVTRKQLLRDVWGIDQEIVTRTIDRHIASVRKKVEIDPANPQHIETVYGIGYRFTG